MATNQTDIEEMEEGMELHDTQTGELVAFDNPTLNRLKAKDDEDFLAKIDQAVELASKSRKAQDQLASDVKTKEDDFEENEQDFWKPDEELVKARIKNKNAQYAEFKGRYQGGRKLGRSKLLTHFFLKAGEKKNKAVVWHILGQTQLTNELKKLLPIDREKDPLGPLVMVRFYGKNIAVAGEDAAGNPVTYKAGQWSVHPAKE